MWSKFKMASVNNVPNTPDIRFCSLGRIVSTCLYLDNDKVMQRLNATISAINGVLYVNAHDILVCM